jgi:hypothetical protein
MRSANIKYYVIILTISACVLINVYFHNNKSNDQKAALFIDTPVPTLDVKSIIQDEKDNKRISYIEYDASIKRDTSTPIKAELLSVSDFCVDNKCRLCIADQKLSKIFVYNDNLQCIGSFGGIGQSQREFLGRLSIRSRDDDKLYISDYINKRISIYSYAGDLIQQQSGFYYDTPAINTKGDVYMLSASNIEVIDKFRDFRLRDQFIDIKYHQSYFIDKPSNSSILRTNGTPPNRIEVLKAISSQDDLACLFNHSLTIIILDDNDKIKCEFRIDHPRFIEDYRERIRKAKAVDGWILPFGSIFFDQNTQICICYYNETLSIPEIYRYKINGQFVDTIRLETGGFRTNQIVAACDKRGYFYGINEQGDEVIRYRMKGNKGKIKGETN